jgi:hypothetical protein
MLLACFSLLGVSANTQAQTCVSPIFFGSNTTLTGDTCTASNELGTLCIFGQSPANDIIYSVTLPAGYTATTISLTNNTAAWNAALVLVQGACNGNSVCPRNADAGGPGANETLDISGLTPAAYFLVVTSTTSDTGCGAYSLSINGTPVELQSFEII